MKGKINSFETKTKEDIRDVNRGYAFGTGDQLKINGMGREG